MNRTQSLALGFVTVIVIVAGAFMFFQFFEGEGNNSVEVAEYPEAAHDDPGSTMYPSDASGPDEVVVTSFDMQDHFEEQFETFRWNTETSSSSSTVTTTSYARAHSQDMYEEGYVSIAREGMTVEERYSPTNVTGDSFDSVVETREIVVENQDGKLANLTSQQVAVEMFDSIISNEDSRLKFEDNSYTTNGIGCYVSPPEEQDDGSTTVTVYLTVDLIENYDNSVEFGR